MKEVGDYKLKNSKKNKLYIYVDKIIIKFDDTEIEEY